MKETKSASLASQSFVFEADAYNELKNYLDDVAGRLPDDDKETMEDIEYRLAEIFHDKLTSPMLVVTLKLVNEATSQLGHPSAFGEPCGGSAHTTPPTPPTPEPNRLIRSRTNRSIAGVCSGLAYFFSIDVTLVRLLTLLLILFGGISIWCYIILWIVVPEEPVQPLGPTQQPRV